MAVKGVPGRRPHAARSGRRPSLLGPECSAARDRLWRQLVLQGQQRLQSRSRIGDAGRRELRRNPAWPVLTCRLGIGGFARGNSQRHPPVVRRRDRQRADGRREGRRDVVAGPERRYLLPGSTRQLHQPHRGITGLLPRKNQARTANRKGVVGLGRHRGARHELDFLRVAEESFLRIEAYRHEF